MASRAELGRFPLAKDIVTSVLKYDQRLSFMDDDEMLHSAYESQRAMTRNSGNTFTYVEIADKLKSQLHLTHHNDVPHALNISNVNQIKGHLASLGRKVSKACEKFYINTIFNTFSLSKRA